MKMNLIQLLKDGVNGVKNRPQILIALVLIVFLPLLFLYTGQQFLKVSRENQDTVLKQRIGMLHDVFTSIMHASGYSEEIIQEEIERISEINPDILSFNVVKILDDKFQVIASNDTNLIGSYIENPLLYRDSSVKFDNSVIYLLKRNSNRIWQAYRAVKDEYGGVVYVLSTETTLESIDSIFKKRERLAFYSLGIVYAVVLIIAFWLLKLTDYRYLYRKASKVIESKDLFTNMLTHELRTPLTAMAGYASMIEESPNESNSKKYAVIIKESTQRLLGIVNDLLDVARMQSGKLKMQLETFPLIDVLERVKAELVPLTEQKSCSVSISQFPSDLSVLADRKRLHQAIINLVTNSIKYSDKGTITISVEQKTSTVEVRIKDSGMGISAEDQKKLFAPFFRVQGSSEMVTGTGLGMYITRELIERMGGSIGVESIKNIGTQIVLTLVLAKK